VFEFPTPYGVENVFLLWRGQALVLLSFCVVAVGVYGNKFLPEPPLPLFGEPWFHAPRWPHLVTALLLALAGAFDLFCLRGQRLLQLTPGQPASLTGEVSREATGSTAGAKALMQMLAGGPVADGIKLDSRWKRWLGRLSAGSTVLMRFLRARGLLALLGCGLLFVLALGALLFKQTETRSGIGLLVMLIGVSSVVRHLLGPERATPTPMGVVALLLAALAGSVALGALGDRLSILEPLAEIGLPLAALLWFAASLLVEMLAIRAARAHGRAKPRVSNNRHVVASEWAGDMRSFMSDIDRELFRRWNEGIPNRRYSWQPPHFEAPGGSMSASVLEESQPSPPPTRGSLAKTSTAPAPLLLLSLYALAWLLAVAAGLLWLWLGYSLYLDAMAGWKPAAAGLSCLLAGVYAARVAHTLCSRTEVHSTLTWLELEGRYSCPPADPRERTPTGAQVLPPVSVHSMTLKACSAQVRSVFYAEAAGMLGGRVLLEVVDDPQLALSWGQVAGDAARGSMETATAAHAGPATPAPPKARSQRTIDRDPPPPRRPPRFCSACGTPVLSGARYCQHCGNVLD
jgi:hypothetical protein